MKKKMLPFAWGLSTLLLVVLATFISGESTHFYGIADDHEQTISFEMPVKIVRTFVVEGEEVKQNDLLMEVRSESLQSNIAIIEEELQELASQDEENIATLESRLLSLNAQQQAQRLEMDSKINTLTSRYKLNKSFVKQLSDSGNNKSASSVRDTANPLLQEIHSLKRQRTHLMESLNAEIDNIKLQLSTEERPIDAQIAGLKEKRAKLLRQTAQLQIRANFTGRVGSVLFKGGETVSPYQPILTIHSANPSYVKAYINENVVNTVELGQTVWVQPTGSAHDMNAIAGTVESLGSRIVEYPARLKKNPLVSAWGREVVVHIEDEHTLLHGEKVNIQLNKPASLLARFFSSSQAVAAEHDSPASITDSGNPVFHKSDTKPLHSTNLSIDIPSIEASGILGNPNDTGYLLVSDEARDGSAELYELDASGRVSRRLQITSRPRGMPEIDDLESISRDGKYMYISASLSRNKNDELKSERRRFIRLEQVGAETVYRGSVDLYSYLESLSISADHPATRRFLSRALSSRNIDIEAHSVMGGYLYIGFKAPLDAEGRSVILKLDKIDRILAGRPARGAIWKTVNMAGSGSETVLTDMTSIGDRLLLLSVKDDPHHPVSQLWCLDAESSRMVEVAVFQDLKAEGISANGTSSNEYMVVFDEGGDTASRYIVFGNEQQTMTGDDKC